MSQQPESDVQRFMIGGIMFWILIAAIPLRVGSVLPGLMAGDPFNFAEGVLDAFFVLFAALILVARFTQPMVELSPRELRYRALPYFPAVEIPIADIASINWVSGSTLGLKRTSSGDTSVGLMLVAKADREALVESLRTHLNAKTPAVYQGDEADVE